MASTKTVGESDFLRRALWTDEVTVTGSRVNNLHNLHEWALENHQR
jgi:hypothetical protein